MDSSGLGNSLGSKNAKSIRITGERVSSGVRSPSTVFGIRGWKAFVL